MSTIKISQLPIINVLNANTSNTLFVAVDVSSGTTGQFTAHTLAQGLFSNEILNVGLLKSTLSNTVAQFTGNSSSYIQVNFQNPVPDGSSDYVVTADNGNDSQYYIDMGMAGSIDNDATYTAFNPNDGYVYVQGSSGVGPGGNLIIGTASQTTNIKFMVGGTTPSNFVARMSSSNISLLRDTYISGNTKITGNLITSIITTSGTNENLILDPNGFGNVVLPLNTELIVQSTLSSNSNTVGSVVINGGLALIGNIYSGGVYVTGSGNGITFVDGTLQTSAGSSVANTIYLQYALDSANANIAYNSGINSTQNSRIQSAWNTANNSLANTNGVITIGDFNISGNLSTLGVASTGLISINAVPFFANTPAVLISGSVGNYSQVPLNQGYMLQITGFANTATRVVIDSFGSSNTTYPLLTGRSARGTALTPKSTANNDILMRISGNGWGNTFSQFGVSRIDMVASENYTDATKGSEIQFWNTKRGSNTLIQIASFNSESIYFSGTVIPAKGFVYNALSYPSAQTAIVIDFANNSVVKTTTSSGLTVTFSNYIPGKVVEIWVTNTAGTNQSFTHGCSAINSSVNSTTYTIPSTSSILAKYISFANDVCNTFVSIIHA